MKTFYYSSNGVISFPDQPLSNNTRIKEVEELLYCCFRSNLVVNANCMKSHSKLSCSSQKMHLLISGVLKELDMDTSGFYAFSLPSMLMTRHGWTKTTNQYQLTRPGTQAFREIAKILFWESLNVWLNRDKRKLPTCQKIWEFCGKHNIDYNDCGNVVRNYHREKIRTRKTFEHLVG